MRFDLHTHTVVSDGTDTPTELAQKVAAAGLAGFALTDHDTTDGWAAAATAAKHLDLVFIPGMELTCSTDGGISVHVLSYLHDPYNEALLDEMEASRRSRESRAQRMVERLAEDYPVDWDIVLEHCAPGATIGRPHIADALVSVGVIQNRSEAFVDLLHPRSRYYVSHYSPDPVHGVELIRAAGGVPVFAHPMAAIRGRVVQERVFHEMIEAGLAGVEVFHRDNSDEGRHFLLKLAEQHDLIVTGSSDYHGFGKPNRLGENTVGTGVVEQIAAQGKLKVHYPSGFETS